MPRDGSGIYSQPFPDVVDGTTIESAVHNGTVSDISIDLNAPRPIVAGGTGANNAYDAMVNLKGEITKQNVTNYDSHPFVSGSFYSVPGATSEPASGYIAGICYVGVDPSGMVIEARDIGTGILYVRRKVSGTWGAWAEQPGSLADADARYVNLTGDTMTGNLSLSSTAPVLYLNRTTLPASSSITGTYNALNRWQLELGNGIAESGSNAGSNLSINRFDDAGGFLGTAFVIERSSGDMNTSGNITAGTNLVSGQALLASSAVYTNYSGATGGVYYFGNNGTTRLSHDGTFFHFNGGTIINNAKSFVSTANTAFTPSVPDAASFIANGGYGGGLTFQDGGGRASIWSETNNLVFSAGVNARKLELKSDSNHVLTGNLQISGICQAANYIKSTVADGIIIEVPAGQYARFNSHVVGTRNWKFGTASSGEFIISDESAGAFRVNIATSGQLSTNGNSVTFGTVTAPGYLSRQALSSPGVYGTVWWNLFYSGGNMLMYADNTYMGVIAIASDYRIKKDVLDLPSMWDTVKALRPIKYTQAEFSPPSHIKHVAEEALKARAEAEENPNAEPRIVETGPFVPADDIERWGFIAHELQETLTGTAATATKDAPDAIQSINLAPVVAALTKALQEAMVRIEALEATR